MRLGPAWRTDVKLPTKGQPAMIQTLFSKSDVAEMITSGELLLLAADESLLTGLPKGNWMGGTIPYFMSAESGGIVDHERIFVTRFPASCTVHAARLYDAESLPAFAQDGAVSGFSIVLLPGFSDVHAFYAENVKSWPDVFARPVVGWVSGVNLSELGKKIAKVIDGRTGVISNSHAAIMHVELPPGIHANVQIVNLFARGDGDVISFPRKGFSAQVALVNGRETNFAEYITENKLDTRLPLVANYGGAMINVSLNQVDAASGNVLFYAPVFPGVEYSFAAPVGEYAPQFMRQLADRTITPVFSCNCVLNFLYAELEGKRMGDVVGPMTFGEVAFILLNQTMVYLTLEKSAKNRPKRDLASQIARKVRVLNWRLPTKGN